MPTPMPCLIRRLAVQVPRVSSIVACALLAGCGTATLREPPYVPDAPSGTTHDPCQGKAQSPPGKTTDDGCKASQPK